MCNDECTISIYRQHLFFLSPSLIVASGIEGIDVIAADVTDDASLEEMCSKTAVLISCVGPVGMCEEWVCVRSGGEDREEVGECREES